MAALPRALGHQPGRSPTCHEPGEGCPNLPTAGQVRPKAKRCCKPVNLFPTHTPRGTLKPRDVAALPSLAPREPAAPSCAPTPIGKRRARGSGASGRGDGEPPSSGLCGVQGEEEGAGRTAVEAALKSRRRRRRRMASPLMRCCWKETAPSWQRLSCRSP